MVARQLQRDVAGVAESVGPVVSRTIHGALHSFALSTYGVPHSGRGLVGSHLQRASLHQYDAVLFSHRTIARRPLLNDGANGRGKTCQAAGGLPAWVVRVGPRRCRDDG